MYSLEFAARGGRRGSRRRLGSFTASSTARHFEQSPVRVQYSTRTRSMQGATAQGAWAGANLDGKVVCVLDAVGCHGPSHHQKPIERRKLLPQWHWRARSQWHWRASRISRDRRRDRDRSRDEVRTALAVMRGRCGDFVAMVEDGVAYNCNHTGLEALQRMRDSWGCPRCRCASRLHVCSTARGSQLVA